MPDIADQLDAAIGAAPSDAPALDETLTLGRRALRRRRLAYGAGAAVTAASSATRVGDLPRRRGHGLDRRPRDRQPPRRPADVSAPADGDGADDGRAAGALRSRMRSVADGGRADRDRAGLADGRRPGRGAVRTERGRGRREQRRRRASGSVWSGAGSSTSAGLPTATTTVVSTSGSPVNDRDDHRAGPGDVGGSTPRRRARRLVQFTPTRLAARSQGPASPLHDTESRARPLDVGDVDAPATAPESHVSDGDRTASCSHPHDGRGTPRYIAVAAPTVGDTLRRSSSTPRDGSGDAEGGRGAAVTRADRESAYVDFVTARRAHLRRIAYALCGDWHRADDLLQIALVKLYVAWPRVRRSGREDAYVRRILVRASIDESRRPWRRERPPRPSRPPGAEPTGVEDRAALFDALQALPPSSGRPWCCGTGSGSPSPRPRPSSGSSRARSRATPPAAFPQRLTLEPEALAASSSWSMTRGRLSTSERSSPPGGLAGQVGVGAAPRRASRSPPRPRR